jgi:uncharacterized protein YijF (DUF1287 family)
MVAGAASACAAPRPPAPTGPGAELVAAARRQIGVTLSYDSGYHRIAYPGGDVPRATGVCADVVVRAARDAWGVDLQKLVHEDMLAHFDAYPRRAGIDAPDPNIDHRRTLNLETYWTRHGARLWVTRGPTSGVGFQGKLAPGDILTWRTFMNSGPHVAVVSAGGAIPRLIQNYGLGVHEDLLAQNWLDGAQAHYRWLPTLSVARQAGPRSRKLS